MVGIWQSQCHFPLKEMKWCVRIFSAQRASLPLSRSLVVLQHWPPSQGTPAGIAWTSRSWPTVSSSCRPGSVAMSITPASAVPAVPVRSLMLSRPGSRDEGWLQPQFRNNSGLGRKAGRLSLSPLWLAKGVISWRHCPLLSPFRPFSFSSCQTSFPDRTTGSCVGKKRNLDKDTLHVTTCCQVFTSFRAG